MNYPLLIRVVLHLLHSVRPALDHRHYSAFGGSLPEFNLERYILTINELNSVVTGVYLN